MERENVPRTSFVQMQLQFQFFFNLYQDLSSNINITSILPEMLSVGLKYLRHQTLVIFS